MKLNALLIALLLLSILGLSCSNEPKKITPTSTEFTSGQLSKLIEVVNEPSELTFSEQDGSIKTQYIQLNVKLKLKKETPEWKNKDPQDLDFISLLSVAVIKLVDEKGTDVQEIQIKDTDLLKLKKLLLSSVGSTENILFVGEFHNSDDAPKWFSNATQFTPYLTADVKVEGADGAHHLSGYVGNNAITMDINISGSEVNGSYYYNKYRSNLNLFGKFEDGNLDIHETNNDGMPTGHFEGQFDNGQYSGTFTNFQGTHFQFSLSEGGATSIPHNTTVVNSTNDYSSSYDYDDDDTDYSSSGSSEDWDAVLSSYENYVDQYIAFMKRATNGDATALSEYPAIMSKAEDLQQKLANAQGEMSPAQWARFERIQLKFSRAAMEM
jgi:hypothetical protein